MVKWYNRRAPNWLVQGTRKAYGALGETFGNRKGAEKFFDYAINVGNRLIPVVRKQPGTGAANRPKVTGKRFRVQDMRNPRIVRRRVSRRAVLRTRGFVGKYKPRVKTRGPGNHLKHGSMKVIDSGGEATSESGVGADSRVLYIGHSCFRRYEIEFSLARAITRALLKQCGKDIVSWNDPVPCLGPGLSIRLKDFDGLVDTTEQTQVTATFNNAAEVGDLADAVRSLLISGHATPQYTPEYTTAELLSQGTGGSGDPADITVEATINLKNAWLDMFFASKLSIQNRTTASSADPTDMHSIENNPIVGYRYMWNGNTPLLRSTYDGRDASILAPPATSGIVEFVPDLLNAKEMERWSRPVKPHFFANCKRSGRVQINPGQIKHSYISYKRKLPFNTFIKMMKDNLYMSQTADTNPVKTSIGCSEVIGLEKMLDSRATSEPFINVGYEHTETYCMSLYYKKSQPGVAITQVF